MSKIIVYLFINCVHFYKYNAGLVSPVKNQGQFGTCWAHAACASMESNALMMGYGLYDLSEYQLAYFAFNIPKVQDSMIAGEGTISGAEGNWYDHAGGNDWMTASLLLKGYAPALEEKYPYKNIKESLPDEAAGDVVFKGNSAIYINVNDVNSIKAAITRLGAMTITVAAGSWIGSNGYGGDYCNPETWAMYLPQDMYGKEYNGATIGIDHSVLVVGWDDTFSKENFATQPEGDGAWLVKNSWSEKWGLDGYFWLSYYDAAIAEAGEWAAFTVSPLETYDYQYQYDGSLGGYFIADATDVAMTFEVNADQTMTGVKIYPANNIETGKWSPTGAEIKIYKNVTSIEELDSAELLYSQKTIVKLPGYQTVEFNKGLNINKGDKLYVVVSFDIPVTYWNDGPQDWGYLISYASGNPGETFMKVARDGKWYDHGVADADDDPANSVCMKVMVRNGHNQEVIHRDPDFVSLDEPTFYLLNNEEAKVTVTWKAVEGAEGYNIYRKIKGVEDDFSLLATVDAATSKYYDIGLTLGVDYTYKVVPFAGNYEGNSAEKTIRATIAAPWLTKLENAKKGEVKISIQKVKDAKSYSVYRLVNGTYRWLGSVDAKKSNTYVDKFNSKYGAYSTGVTYSYKLTVKRGDRTSALSAAKSITVNK